MKNTFEKIAVYCGSSPGNSEKINETAHQVGQFLAKKEIELVFGAGKIGVMGMLVESLLNNNGKVIGVIPEFLKTKEIVHADLTELITTKTMHKRKEIMCEISDGFIILPGGFGTMDEFFEVLTWAQLGLHQKPIGILNVDNYYDDLLNLFKTMIAKKVLKQANLNLITVSDNIEELYQKMIDYEPQATPKWLNKN